MRQEVLWDDGGRAPKTRRPVAPEVVALRALAARLRKRATSESGDGRAARDEAADELRDLARAIELADEGRESAGELREARRVRDEKAVAALLAWERAEERRAEAEREAAEKRRAEGWS